MDDLLRSELLKAANISRNHEQFIKATFISINYETIEKNPYSHLN